MPVHREAENFRLHTSDFHSLPENNAALFIDNVNDKPRLFPPSAGPLSIRISTNKKQLLKASDPSLNQNVFFCSRFQIT